MKSLVYMILASFLFGGALISMQVVVERAAASGRPGEQPAAVEEPATMESATPEKPKTAPQETDSEQEDETFVPSEKLPAGSAISFPVNI